MIRPERLLNIREKNDIHYCNDIKRECVQQLLAFDHELEIYNTLHLMGGGRHLRYRLCLSPPLHLDSL